MDQVVLGRLLHLQATVVAARNATQPSELVLVEPADRLPVVLVDFQSDHVPLEAVVHATVE